MAKNPAQELFGGYYPGDALPRDPNTGNVIQWPTASSDIFKMYMDLFSYFDLSKFPPGLQKIIQAEIKRSWSASADTQEGTYNLETVEIHDGTGVPGAFGTKISANPVEWFTNPAGVAQDFAKDVRKKLFEWEDVDSRFEKLLVIAMINGDVPRIENEEIWIGNQVVAARSNRAIKRAIKQAEAAGISAATFNTQLNGLGVFREHKGKEYKSTTTEYDATTGVEGTAEVDVYKNWGNKLVGFYLNSNTSSKRDRTYTAHLEAAVDAVSTEVSKYFGVDFPSGVITIDPATGLVDFADATRAIGDIEAALTPRYGPASADYAKKIYGFFTEAAYSESISGNAKAVKDLADLANMHRFCFSDFSPGSDAFTKIEKQLTTVKKNLAQGEDEIKRLRQYYQHIYAEKIPTDLLEILNEHEYFINAVRSELRLTADLGITSDIADAMSKLAGGIGGNKVGFTSAGNVFTRLQVILNGTATRAGINVGDLVQNGTFFKMMRRLAEREFGLIEAKEGVEHFGQIIADLDLNANKAGRVHVTSAYIDRFNGAVKEFLDNVVGGELFKTYVWTRLKAYTQAYTPWTYVTVFLKRAHYFGLTFDFDPDDAYPGFAWADRLFKNKATLNRIGVSVDLGGTTRNISVLGGNHFKGITSLYKPFNRATDKLDPELLKFLMFGDPDPHSKFTIGFIRAHLLNADPSRPTTEHLELMARMAGLAGVSKLNFGVRLHDLAEVDKFLNNLDAMRAWWATHAAGLGFNPNNFDHFWALFQALGKFNANFGTYFITNEYLGILQKVAQKLNLLQAGILNKLSFVLGPMSYIKTLISEAIAGLIISGTAGLALPLKWLLAMGVRSFLDLGESLVKGILSMNFSDFLKQMDKMGNAAMRWIVVAVGGVFITIAALVMLLITIFAGGVSPNEAPRGGGVPVTGQGSGGFPGTGPLPTAPNPDNECPLAEDYRYLPSHMSYNNAGGHGTNAYWDRMVGYIAEEACEYPIPVLGSIFYASFSGSYCSRPAPTGSPFYGNALDVFAKTGGNTVYAPKLQNIPEWYVSGVTGGGIGNALHLTGSDEGVEYKLYFTHLGSIDSSKTNTTVPISTGIAQLYPWGSNTHLHMELKITGTDGVVSYVRPEDYLCRTPASW